MNQMRFLTMSKDKILNFPLVNRLFWEIPFGDTIELRWPKTRDIADTNELMRPWLEENVGLQGFDWDWKVKFKGGDLKIDLKFRKKVYASQFVLIFSEHM
jgi:hypothetical protein